MQDTEFTDWYGLRLGRKEGRKGGREAGGKGLWWNCDDAVMVMCTCVYVYAHRNVSCTSLCLIRVCL